MASGESTTKVPFSGSALAATTKDPFAPLTEKRSVPGADAFSATRTLVMPETPDALLKRHRVPDALVFQPAPAGMMTSTTFVPVVSVIRMRTPFVDGSIAGV